MEFLLDQTILVAKIEPFDELEEYSKSALENKIPLGDVKYTSLKEEYQMDIPPKFEQWLCKTIDNTFVLHKPEYGIYGVDHTKLKIRGMWTNRMSKGEQHYPHIHQKSFYSFAAYIKTSNDDAPFYFIKDNKGTPIQIDENSAGHIIIFPSTLIHTVYPKMTDGERISVSGNIIINV
ncbi:hypothetical protein [Synechococcus phage S-H25]|nr:hypothetical protein [Synechococcus phage S-H25]